MSESRSREILTPAILTGAALVTGLLLVWWARDDLPDRIATHWGLSGEADSFSTVGRAMLFPLIAAPLQLAVLLGIGGRVKQTRMMAHFAAGLSGFLVVIGFGTILAQRGSTDGGGGRIDLVLALSLAAGLAMAALTRVLLGAPDPLARTTEPLPASAPRLEGPTATAIAWTGAIRVSRSARWIPLIVAGPIVALGLVMQMSGGPGWFLMLTALLLGVLFAATLHCRLVIDQRGVRVVVLGLINWMTTPLASVVSARSTTVRPLGDYGGWGYRIGLDGSIGLVTAAGEALEVRRADGTLIRVTVNASDEAARTVNTLIASQRGTAPPTASH